eukprot:751336-Hanusia_phi.AAC.2
MKASSPQLLKKCVGLATPERARRAVCQSPARGVLREAPRFSFIIKSGAVLPGPDLIIKSSESEAIPVTGRAARPGGPARRGCHQG